MKKAVLRTLCVMLSAVVLAVGSYLLYIVLSYNRVEDNIELSVSGNADDAVTPIGQELSLITYNIGFGAYSRDYSFFMDGGEHSRAFSKDAVIHNTNGALEAIKKENPTFVMLQEVDTKGTRSYDVNQAEIMENGLSSYQSIFAENYNSPYFLYPFSEPIGANESGIMTFSKYPIKSAIRRSLPIENSLYKYFDLDRAYSAARLNTGNGKELVIYNVHLSAYTSDGTIADSQLKMLGEDMKAEYDKGNYVIAAGDFNKDVLGDSSQYFERSEGDFTWGKPLNISMLSEEFAAYSGKNAPTCRNADSPFRGDGTDYVLSVDGILISDNVELISSDTLDLDFEFSDHNPVKAKFILK